MADDGGHSGNGHGGNGHGTGLSEPPPVWPRWEQRITDPQQRIWRVRTVDILEAPDQLHPRLVKTVAETKGRFRTTVISPHGALAKDVYVPERDQAVSYHRRMVREIRAGRLMTNEP
jgi:hypothetical protein